MKGFGIIEVGKAGWMEHDVPQIGPYDALLRPLMIAPCSSDTHVLHGGAGNLKDRILGHESVGEIIEVGSEVKNFRPGDVVAVPCCTPDWTEVAIQQRGANSAHDNGGRTRSFKFVSQKDGVFAEQYSVNNADSNLAKIPEGVSLDAALMATDMMSTGFYGAEMANINFGDSVVVFGIGPVGLMAVAAAALKGAGRIIAIGTRPNCVELAKEYGATDIVSYKNGDIPEQVLDINGGKVDSVILAGGKADSFNQALKIIKHNGTISSINFFDPSEQFVVPANDIFCGMGDVTLRGGFCPGGAYRINKMLALIANSRIHPEKLINYHFEGFDKIEDAFNVMDQKPRDLIKPAVRITW